MVNAAVALDAERLRRGALEIAGEVADPQIPVLSIADLGVLRDARVQGDGTVEVDITPTYSGCPTMNMIALNVEAALAAAGIAAQVKLVLAPAWTTDWMTQRGRDRRRDCGTTMGTTMAMRPVFEDGRIPFISLAGGIEIIEPVAPFAFKTPHTDKMACEQIFADIRARGLSRVGMISGTDGFGQSTRTQCQRVAGAAGITIVADEQYGPHDSDMTPQLTRIRNTAGVEAVVNAGFGQGPAIVTRGQAQLGIRLPLYQSHGVASAQFIELATPQAAEGVRLPAAALLVAEQLPESDPQRRVLIDYQTTFEREFNQPVFTFGGHPYDGLMILVEAIRRANSTDGVRVHDQIRATRGFVGTGGVVNMSATDHMGLDLSAFRMVEIRGGQFRLIGN